MAVEERERGGEAGFAAALEERFAADRKNLRIEACFATAALLVFCGSIRLWEHGSARFWPFDTAFLLVVACLAAAPFALELLARGVPSRARRVERLDGELAANGALVAADEIDPRSASTLGELLRRTFARRLKRPLSPNALAERRERRRKRALKWLLLAILLWILMQFLPSYLGPRGVVPRGDTGAQVGPRVAQTGEASGTGAGSREGRQREGERQREAESPKEDERSSSQQGSTPPLPPPPQRRLEDLFVTLKEQANAGAKRDLWVVPLGAGDGEGEGEAGSSGAREANTASAPERHFEPAGVEELRRAAERAALPETLGERERAWVERYFAALRKLP